MIDDLIEKSHHSIQLQLATGNEDSTDLIKLARHCQRIEHQLKSVDCAQFMEDQNAKQKVTRRNNGLEPNKAIVSALISSAAPVPANLNPTPRMAYISEPHIQAAAPPRVSTRPTTAMRPTICAIPVGLRTSKLTNEEIDVTAVAQCRKNDAIVS